jgi:hypothetical protein
MLRTPDAQLAVLEDAAQVPEGTRPGNEEDGSADRKKGVVGARVDLATFCPPALSATRRHSGRRSAVEPLNHLADKADVLVRKAAEHL